MSEILTWTQLLENPDQLILLKGKPLFAMSGLLDYPSLEQVVIKRNQSKNNNTFPIYYGLYLDKEKKQSEENVFLTELLLAESILNEIDWSTYSEEKKRKEIWKETSGKWSNYFSLEESNNTPSVKKSNKSIQDKIKTFGIFILLSSSNQDLKVMLNQYRQRDEVEKLFDAGKNELCGNPLRVHKSSTMKSTLFVLFLSIIVQTYLLGKMKTGEVDSKYSMHSLFFELQKLKKAIWKGKTCLINEITKTQRILFKQLNIVLPKCLGN